MYAFLTTTGMVGQVLYQRDVHLSYRTLLSFLSKQFPLFRLLPEIATSKLTCDKWVNWNYTVVLKRPESGYFWSVLTTGPGLRVFTGWCLFCGRWESCLAGQPQHRGFGSRRLLVQDHTPCFFLSSWLQSVRATAIRSVFSDKEEFSNRRDGAIVQVVEGGGRGNLAEQQGNLLSLLPPD